ncbi:MAG: nucleotidyltransferase [Actinomycetota bacterium]|nr:nucleotidyltransferase [Actinomycetota bacterium]
MLLSPGDVREALRELAIELRDDGLTARIRVVGGAAVSLRVGREALTRDIDALVYPPSPDFAEVVRRVGERRGWAADWLIDGVKAFVSHRDDEEDWDVMEDEAGVTILVAQPRLLLAMKLLAGRGRRDLQDVELLLDAIGIANINEAEAVFDHFYPEEKIPPRSAAYLRSHFDAAP